MRTTFTAKLSPVVVVLLVSCGGAGMGAGGAHSGGAGGASGAGGTTSTTAQGGDGGLTGTGGTASSGGITGTGSGGIGSGGIGSGGSTGVGGCNCLGGSTGRPDGSAGTGGTAGTGGRVGTGGTGDGGTVGTGGSVGGASGTGGSSAVAVDAAPDGQAVDCSLVGCAAAPWCGEQCQSACGCCPCQEGEVDVDGNRCQGGCWLATAGGAHCLLPWDEGSCSAEISAYWFNTATNRCEPRTYGGCGGNANRFESLLECERDCARVPGPSNVPLPVVYEFGDHCQGRTLTEAGRKTVAEFVASKVRPPLAADAPHILVDLMAGNNLCQRQSDVVLPEAGVEAFVSYFEYGEMGYLPAHEGDIPVDAITTDLTELSKALGVNPPQVEWR